MISIMARQFAIFILGLVLLAGAAKVASAQTAPAAEAVSAASSNSGDPTGAYRLGPGDKVRVIVFGEQELTGEFLVSGDGKISMPLVGEVPASGKTIAEFQSKLQDVLKDGFLRDPKVSAEVLTYRPFYILGEVGKPGEYPYTNGLTVLNAVATAQGFTYRADTKKVFIKRANEAKEHRSDLTSATSVSPGDTIRIGERFF